MYLFTLLVNFALKMYASLSVCFLPVFIWLSSSIKNTNENEFNDNIYLKKKPTVNISIATQQNSNETKECSKSNTDGKM